MWFQKFCTTRAQRTADAKIGAPARCCKSRTCWHSRLRTRLAVRAPKSACYLQAPSLSPLLRSMNKYLGIPNLRALRHFFFAGLECHPKSMLTGGFQLIFSQCDRHETSPESHMELSRGISKEWCFNVFHLATNVRPC